MIIKFLKILFFIILFYQNPLYSKSKTLKDFNSKNLSNYFSGIVAYDNQYNKKALKFFQSSNFLIKKHDPYLKKYIYSLVLENKIKKATSEIKQNLKNNNSNFFEAYLILALDSLKEKDFKKSQNYLDKSFKFIKNDRLELVIYETLKEYLIVFKENKIPKKEKKFGNFSFINEVFQRCYLEDKNTNNYFRSLINSQNDMEYSRYFFFYIHYLVENNKLDDARQITNNLDSLDNSLLSSQGKAWIEKKKLDKFIEIFSCKNPNDLIGEFFFLIANLYATQTEYNYSNFYLNISQHFNPKFKFNLSLLAENYYTNNNYKKAKFFLDHFSKEDDLYYWFKLKKEAQMISKEFSDEEGLNFINKKFKKINNPSIKMIFDVANFNKSSKKYKEAINYYDKIILKNNIDLNLYSELLYRRGSAYERLGDYSNADKDLLKSLKINPDDAYVLNYLAYSWLERDYKIDSAIQMLEKAYELKSNDPYIIDSIGWAYFLINDFLKAEKFLKRAVELMPEDPVVNDHYGDILWKLNRKIQARYFWTSVLNIEETEDQMKKDINFKLIQGLKAS
jgi:tetratricopeptide (TPR) repeat protein